MNKNSFKILNKKLVFEFERGSKRFQFYLYHLLFPNGKTNDFFVHRAQPFAIIIPQLASGELIMVRQYRLGMNKVSLEFPMGWVKGLSPLAMAKRELKEETGFTAGKIQLIGQFYLSPAWSNQKAYVYLAKDLTPGKSNPEPYEFIQVERKTANEIENLIKDGEINDAPTISAFYYYKNLFGKNAGNMRRI